MSGGLTRMLGRVLGRPGAVSFRKQTAVVAGASALEDDLRTRTDTQLRQAARAYGDAVLGREPDQPSVAGSRGRASDDPMSDFLAVAREVADRTVHLRPVDEQLLAAAALMAGNAVEMDTGEGKTLAGAIAAAGLALQGRQVHVLAVNDYLAARDAEWMGPLFEFLGLEVAALGQTSSREERREAYRADVVYVPVAEVGFDLLRDRFVVSAREAVHPVFDAAIVDEADAVMIDEATVPLVLAGESADAAAGMERATELVRELRPGEHFEIDDDRATVTLTDAGLDALEARLHGLNLYGDDGVALLTQLNLALHARVLVHRDVDYLVDDGEIRLIDAGRGRVALRRRWPDGLHAAVEAKEGLTVSSAGVVLDTVTIHDLLTRYASLAGMSGTVVAVADDLLEFYRLPTGRIERHVPSIRIDLPEQILLTQAAKREAVVAAVQGLHASGRPVLVGTQSVAESDALAAALEQQGIASKVLNARNDADEARIVAGAGALGAVTISTQMSGRGTDIRLGGAEGADAEGAGAEGAGAAEAEGAGADAAGTAAAGADAEGSVAADAGRSSRDRVAALGGLAVVSTGRYPSGRLDAQLRGRAGRQGDPGGSLSFASLDDDLVRASAPAHLLTTIEREGTELSPARRAAILRDSQAIAESIRLDRHRSTWAYNRVVVRQRATVLEARDRLLAEAAEAGEGSGDSPEERMREAARQIELFHLDDEWQAHLAVLSEVRDGIHLRALAGLVPVDEFSRIAREEFDGFFERVASRTASVVAALTPDALEGGLTALGLVRPSATWTYMMTDNPLGTPGDRAVRALGRGWRRALKLE
ncbi:accessory Sec system translocase SecA2 [Herbiconiux sp. CPCC 205763]|uniref:Protein translocase subunit SecA n=1 Tax=Herbiconiux aconitum TaxID=2970913 RepID=A0ABT2GT05_9MICO|nr:accessory Sec system translocase SecA2 [Herbiconiux aconitum]MCS5718069.1 accessory Sec system translocase SecA2 [Herbiconiux aconitum]